MSKEKQIEEMALELCRPRNIVKTIHHRTCDNCDTSSCDIYELCVDLYNAGYRKQSEGEWVEHIRVSKEGKPLLRHYQCNLCGVYLATQANFCPNCGAKIKGG